MSAGDTLSPRGGEEKKKNARYFCFRISVFEKVTRSIFKLPLC